LLQRIDNAVVAAKQLKEDFNNVRAQLLLTRKSVPGLKDGVQEYGEAAVPAGAGLLAAVASVTAILFPPMATKARELRDTADPDKRLSAAQAALGVLNGIEPGLDHAIVVVGQLIDFWSQLSIAIKGTTPNQLVGTNHATLKKCHKRWTDIEKQYKDYARAASLSQQRLEVEKGRKAISTGGARARGTG